MAKRSAQKTSKKLRVFLCKPNEILAKALEILEKARHTADKALETGKKTIDIFAISSEMLDKSIEKSAKAHVFPGKTGSFFVLKLDKKAVKWSRNSGSISESSPPAGRGVAAAATRQTL